MRLLIIEDNIDTVQGIMDEADDNNWECKLSTFEEANNCINTFSPDIIVLDWMYDTEEVDKGNDILNKIYSSLFIPTIIFSAIEKTIMLDEDIRTNPLISKISKGDEQPVIDVIHSWIPYLEAIRDFKKDLNSALLSAIDVIGFFLSTEDPGKAIVEYMLNKRANYFFDQETVCIDDIPPVWIAYEYPPMKGSILSGDVIRKIPQDRSILMEEGSPEEYFVVLTPSCDIERATDEKKILLAKCCASDQFLKTSNYKKEDMMRISIEEKKEKKAREFSKVLNKGYNNSGEFILPQLPKRIPNITVNLRELELVELGKIALSEKNIQENNIYYRVASLDSPFREHIIWAYMQTACRPGLPNRDTFTWAKELLFN